MKTGSVSRPWKCTSEVMQKGVSGYRGVKFGKGLTDKELRVLAMLKK
jgi:hypothetical protein